MIRSFVFSQGKLHGQDLGLDFLKLVLYDEDVQIWADIEGGSDEEAKALLEGVFNFHPLAVEDCIAVTENPKIEEYEHYLFGVIHAVDYSQSTHEFCTSELNLFIGKNFLVTYHREPLRGITSTIDRVMKNSAAVARAPDRLTYTLLDFLLDSYEPALETLTREFDLLENNMLKIRAEDVLTQTFKLKSEVQRLRQIITPQRDVIARLARGEFKLVRAHMLPYYRDLLDRLVRISDMTDNYRDTLHNILQVHLNMQQVQANRVMKVLTVLATLSMPFLAITSFYGMNFQHMPELKVEHAHIYVFVVTMLFTYLIYWMLKKKRWI